MHILIIPSWYPHKKHPAGLFIYEQILAISKYSDTRISVLNWGPNEFVLKLRNPWESLLSILRFPFTKSKKVVLNSQVTEYYQPQITWISSINNGNYDALIKKALLLITSIQKDSGKIDLVHAHVSFPAGYMADLICKRLDTPFIITEHSGPFPFKEYQTAKGIKSIVLNPLLNANKVIAVSSSLAESIEGQTSIKPDILPNSVDTDLFIPQIEPLKHKSPVIFTLSNINEAKGIGELLEAIKFLKSKGHAFYYRIGGSGYKLHYYKKQAKKLNIDDRIEWLGFINRADAVKEYQNCDFYVMPSRLESLSMVILEAMACGKPIVATDCGGPRDLINETNGILVSPNDSHSLASGMETMLKTFHTYDVEKIREQCITRFSNRVIVNKLMDIYTEVIKSHDINSTNQ
jgi:glycosyltransferase involved in cell wall biosynthesis